MGHVNSNSQRTTVIRKLFHLLQPIVTFVSQVLLFVSQFICGEVTESDNGNKPFEFGEFGDSSHFGEQLHNHAADQKYGDDGV